MKSRQREIVFSCGDIKLEGSCYFPSGAGVFPAVTVCHPHPLYGGSMYNNVIMAVSSALVDRSIIALTFNFRGVGHSQGSFGAGIAEQDDIRAALDWLAFQPEVEANKLGLAGYSFGATVALPVGCGNTQVKAMALISPPIEPSQVVILKDCTKPKLVVCGDQDSMISYADVETAIQEAAEPKQLELISDADHFWLGFEKELAKKVADFFHGSFSKT